MSQPTDTIPAGYEKLKPKPLPGFENSGDIYWHKLGRASIDFAALKDTREDRTHVTLKAPKKQWYHALENDLDFEKIRWFKDPTGRQIPPNRYGYPDFMQVFNGYPEIPVEGQGDELGEIFTEAADTVVLRHGENGLEVLLLQRASGYYALPGGIRQQKDDEQLYTIDEAGVYFQNPGAKEPPAETARRSLEEKAAIKLPAEAFENVIYTGIVDDVRNASGAAMYSTVFSVVDDDQQLKPRGRALSGNSILFVPINDLLHNSMEPTLNGLWGSHTYFVKLAVWSEYVIKKERFAQLSETEQKTAQELLAYDSRDILMDEEVTYAAQNQWASAQWNHRLPWPVRGPITAPLESGHPLAGMEKLQGHKGLVPAWIMKKARRLPDYSIADLVSDLELHRDNHSDIPEYINFRYLEVLKYEPPEVIQKWMKYLGTEAIEANRVWVSSANSVLARLGIDKKQLGVLKTGSSAMESLLEMKRQMIAVEGARSIAELIQMLAENDQACDFMVNAHSAWREHAYRKDIQPGQIATNPYRPGERSIVIRGLVQEMAGNVKTDLGPLAEKITDENRDAVAREAAQAIAKRVIALRQSLESNPLVSGAQTFYLMLQIGRALEELGANRALPPFARNQIYQQISDLVYVIKMDANSAVISGILNAARKQGARLKYKIEPE